jgi:hypothetical protein
MIPIRATKIRGPWFSLGFHIDLQKRYVDLHIWWWIITIGTDYYLGSQERYMSELHVFSNDTEHWIAETLDDAVSDWESHFGLLHHEEYGSDPEDVWYQVPDDSELTVFWREEDWPPPALKDLGAFDYDEDADVYIVVRTCKEWTKIFTEGLLCSEEY